uniref:Uncharacterized protein n=1 Tax=Rhizophora mucronata TaxID=61149 RepID=A0A2P2PW61_RHIMU
MCIYDRKEAWHSIQLSHLNCFVGSLSSYGLIAFGYHPVNSIFGRN